MMSSTCYNAPVGFSLVPVGPVGPVTFLNSATVDSSHPMMFALPNGEAVMSNIVPVPVMCSAGPLEPSPIHDVSSTLSTANSPCTSPRPFSPENVPDSSNSTCFDGRCVTPSMPACWMNSSMGCTDKQFVVTQFPILSNYASGPCVAPVASQCSMNECASYTNGAFDGLCNMPYVAFQEQTALQSPRKLGLEGTESASEASTVCSPEKSNIGSFDLAEHVAAPSFPCAASDIVAQVGDARKIMYDPLAKQMVEEALENGNYTDSEAVISWLEPMVLILSRSKMGSPVIQSALESAGKDQQIALIQGLRGHVIQLMLCFNGNHILQKSLTVMSGAPVEFILDELAQYPGGWSAIIKHVFGCRVAQRAIEHCTEQATEGIVTAVEAEAKVCVEHKFANYVLQSIIEHGTPSQKWRIINALIKLGIPNLTQSLIPSYVVEKTFDNGDEKCKQAIAEAILSWRGAIVHMGCNRWGSGMVKRIMDAQKILGETLYGEALQQLFAGREVLRRSKHGRKFARIACDFIDTPAAGGNSSESPSTNCDLSASKWYANSKKQLRGVPAATGGA